MRYLFNLSDPHHVLPLPACVNEWRRCVTSRQDREELFAFPINWQIVESHGIIQSKMRPWIVKKIIEYLGEEEKTLTEFILTKLGQRAPPQVRACVRVRGVVASGRIVTGLVSSACSCFVPPVELPSILCCCVE